MNKSNYIAITIGPITESLQSARKTRELWAASYLFSYIMRKIAQRIDKEKGVLILPAPDYLNQKNHLGAGLYPDKIIVEESERVTIECLDKWVIDVFSELATKIARTRKVCDEFSENQVHSYLRRYFNLSLAQVVVNSNTNAKGERENVIFECTKVLDSLELSSRIRGEETPRVENRGSDFYQMTPYRMFLNCVNGSFLYKNGFKKPDNGQEELWKLYNMRPQGRFDSLIEIATRELREKNKTIYDEIIRLHLAQDSGSATQEDEAESNVLQSLFLRFKDDLKARHAYVCIVHADGDSVSEIIKSLPDDNIVDFSKKLLDYSQQATELIVRFGGAPIYMGGDDMLFIAPVMFDGRTILELLCDLDSKFSAIFAQEIENIKERNKTVNQENKSPVPSMSYGVMISYYKYPLYEALKASYNLLDDVKKEKTHPGKNAINLRLRKHSGQTINFLIRKGPEREKLISSITKLFATVRDGNFLNGFTYKLMDLSDFLLYAAVDENRLQHFFRNNFNETWQSHNSFYLQLIESILEMKQVATGGKLGQDDLNNLYALLRIVHFTHSETKAYAAV